MPKHVFDFKVTREAEFALSKDREEAVIAAAEKAVDSCLASFEREDHLQATKNASRLRRLAELRGQKESLIADSRKKHGDIDAEVSLLESELAKTQQSGFTPLVWHTGLSFA